MTEQEIFQLCVQAITSPFGVELSCTNVSVFQNHFYKLRKEHDAFKLLKMRKGLSPNTLWLTHETPKSDA